MSENIYVNEYRKYLELNRDRFESILNKISQTESLHEKEKLGKQAIKIAVSTATGYYSSDILEKVYTDIAKSHSIKLDEQFAPNSFLHIMTEAYLYGGHTRVVERWIEISDPNQKHSVIFTENRTKIMPEALIKAVKDKNGTIAELDRAVSAVDRALELRKIASGYEYIILHVHTNDPIPLIAFGTEEFKRPIIFFNHADHVFWLGVSIADIVADLKSFGQRITLDKRNATKSFMLNVPMASPNTMAIKGKADVRAMLNLPVNKKIILSYGSQYKYKPLLDLNFYNYLQLMAQRDDILLIIIGREKRWYPEMESFEKQYPEKLLGLPLMPHKELMDYICAADLIVDSFPMPGITAIIDAVSAGIPVLSLRNLVGQQDYVIESKAYCNTIEELAEKSANILDSKETANENIKDVAQRMQENVSSEVFAIKLSELYRQAPNIHSLHSFKSEHLSDFIDPDVFVLQKCLIEKQLFTFFNLFRVTQKKEKGAKYTEYEIKIFNKSFLIMHYKKLL